jgi:hypothetical protein
VADFFRIVRSERPGHDDFRSQRGGGEPEPEPGDDDLAVALWAGVSTFATEVQARNKARDMPFLGSYIAHLDVPDGPDLPHARTTRTRGQWTLWGRPDALNACVRSTVRV